MQTYTSNDGRKWPVSDKWPMNDPNPAIRMNARNILERLATEVLDGRELEDVFGKGATLDQVHRNTWTSPTCGCTLHFLFDHHKAQAGEQHEHIPHRVVEACDLHKHLTDPVAHYKAVHEHHWQANEREAAAKKN